MIGHLLARVICLLVGHTREQFWKVTRVGVAWECQRCHGLTPSRVLVRRVP